MANATLKARATMDDSPFQRGLRRMKAAAASTAKAIGSSFKGVGKVGAVGLGAGAIAGAVGMGKLTRRSYENAAALQRVSKMTGVAVRDLSVLSDIFEQNGSNLEGLANMLSMMEKNLASAGSESEKTKAALELMGITVDEFFAASPSQKFIQLSRGISSMEKPIARMGAATMFFGKQGKELLPIMQDIADADLSNKDAEADTLEDFASKAYDFKKSMAAAQDSVERFGLGVATKLVPGARKGADVVASMGDAFQEAGEKSAEWAKGVASAALNVKRISLSPLANWLEKATGAKFLGKMMLGRMGAVDFPVDLSWLKKVFENQEEIPPMISEGKDPFSKFVTRGDGSSLGSTGGLRGASNAVGSVGARSGLNPLAPAARKEGLALLPLKERRAIENMRAAQTGLRAGSTPAAFAAVKRGDRERHKEVERDRVRMREGLDQLVQQNEEMIQIMREWNQ